MSSAVNPTEERIDLTRYEDDLPADTLPGFRPARFPEQAAGERKVFLAIRRVWRKFAAQLWEVLQLPGKAATHVVADEVWAAWGPEEQARFERLVSEFSEALMGNAPTPDEFAQPRAAYTPVTNSLHDGEPILPEHMRAMYRVGIDRALAVLGEEAAAVGGVRNEAAIQEMMRIGFDRLSDGARARLCNVLDGTVPGGSVRDLLNAAMERGENPLVVARELRAKFADIEGYNWARLARTETSFAQNAAIRDEYEAAGYALTAGVSLPPFHPNCVCSSTIRPSDKRIMLDVALTACEICQAHLLEERIILGTAPGPRPAAQEREAVAN
jgi:hypothetical protein